jgi:NAD(P)-dependent dehydrogenase (short-subunit alcohol dehydrogenase family)
MDGSKLAVVSGAARGIGAASAERFRREGHELIGIATSPPEGLLANDPGVHWVLGDVAEPRTWTQVSDAIRAIGRPPSTLVLNAARAQIGTVLTVSLEQWKAQFAINVFGAVLGVQACLPPMIENGGGSVVVISSVNGWMAEQGLIAYSSTKATLIEFARCLAVDHARQGIRVNVVAPGTVDTPAFRRAMGTAADPESFIESRRQRNPIPRILTADEIANVVWFLSCDESSGMTGSVVTVDAGLTASYDFRDLTIQGYQ